MNNEFGKFVLDNTKLISVALLPTEALLTWLFFFRRFSFVECFVFWLFCNGAVFVFKILTAPVYFGLISHKTSLDHLFSVFVFAIMLWHLIALFGKKAGWFNIVKCILLINLVMFCSYYSSGYLIEGNDIFSYPLGKVFKEVYSIW